MRIGEPRKFGGSEAPLCTARYRADHEHIYRPIFAARNEYLFVSGWLEKPVLARHLLRANKWLARHN